MKKINYSFFLILLGLFLVFQEAWAAKKLPIPDRKAPQKTGMQPVKAIDPTSQSKRAKTLYCTSSSLCPGDMTCLGGVCTEFCDDTDAGVTAVGTDMSNDPQVKKGGYVEGVKVTSVNQVLKYEKVKTLDGCKGKNLLNEAVCTQATPTSKKAGAATEPSFRGVICPKGTLCGYEKLDNLTVAACLPDENPSQCDEDDACLKAGIKETCDQCPKSGCQTDQSQCGGIVITPDLCPDESLNPGVQEAYPYKVTTPGGKVVESCSEVKNDVCTDPDPAKTYPNATVICTGASGSNGGLCFGETHLDTCKDATHVLHVICGGNDEFTTSVSPCDPGETCHNGICGAGGPEKEVFCQEDVAANSPNSDNPSKLNWLVHTDDNGAGSFLLDECQDAGHVKEYQCDLNTFTNIKQPAKVIACGPTEECKAGVCAPKGFCDASDALPDGNESNDPHQKSNVTVKDKATGVSSTHVDSCNADSTGVYETLCDEVLPAGYSLKEIFCAPTEECLDGACIAKDPVLSCNNCQDSDLKDPDVFSVLTVDQTKAGVVSSVSVPDACDGEVHTVEHTCNASNPFCYDTHTIACDPKKFCEQGRCKLCVASNGKVKHWDPVTNSPLEHASTYCEGNTLHTLSCGPAGEFVDSKTPCALGCENGQCKQDLCAPYAGKPLPDVDGNPCTKETCDPNKGIVSTPLANGASCSDGQACNGAETCQAGACKPGTPKLIDDGNACTVDQCAEPLGTVTHTPVPNGASCGDGKACNGSETCQSGVCKTGLSIKIDDGDACTDDACVEPAGTVTHKPSDKPECQECEVIATQVASGSYHTCIIGHQKNQTVNGVWCWGVNYGGQLGINKMIPYHPSAIPVKGIDDVKEIAAGRSHNCVLGAYGGVQCWGGDDLNQLGILKQVLPPSPPVDMYGNPYPIYTNLSDTDVSELSDIVDIHASASSTCALDSLGDVWCWGFGGDNLVKAYDPLNTQGYHFFDYLVSPSKVDSLSGIFKLPDSLKSTFAFQPGTLTGNTQIHCGITEQKNIGCFGENGGNPDDGLSSEAVIQKKTYQSPQTSDLQNIKSLSYGYLHACAQNTDNEILCWGENYQGEVNPNKVYSGFTDPMPVMSVEDTAQIALGSAHTCIAVNGEVWCWGTNVLGQSGQANASASGIKKVDWLSGVVELSAGNNHTCALTDSGKVYCWGLNDVGQLGLGYATTIQYLPPPNDPYGPIKPTGYPITDHNPVEFKCVPPVDPYAGLPADPYGTYPK